MSYTVPAYTEISHFRAPYKNSFMGFGAARADSTSTSRPSINVGAEGKSFGIGGKRPLPKNTGLVKRPPPKKKGGFSFLDSSGGKTAGGGGAQDDLSACPENAILGQSGNCECIEGFAPDAAGEICVKAPKSCPPNAYDVSGRTEAFPPNFPLLRGGGCACKGGFVTDSTNENCVAKGSADAPPPADKAGLSSAVPYIVGAGILGALAWLAMSPKKAV
jgi:hypothetical protein